jgi:hypothetical protein
VGVEGGDGEGEGVGAVRPVTGIRSHVTLEGCETVRGWEGDVRDGTTVELGYV